MNRLGDSAEQHGWTPELSQLPELRPHSEAGGHAPAGPAAGGTPILLHPGLHLPQMLLILFPSVPLFSLGFETSYFTATTPSTRNHTSYFTAKVLCACMCVCVHAPTYAHTHSCSVNYTMITTYQLKSHSCLGESFLGAKCSKGNICSHAPSPEPTYEVSPRYSALTNTRQCPACPCFFNSNIH